MSLVNYFDNTFLINLRSRPDRLSLTSKEMRNVGWHIGPGGVTVFPACQFDRPDGFANAGVRGCFNSHLSCLVRAKNDLSRHAMLLEDDIALSSAIQRLSPQITDQLEQIDWGIVYLGYGESEGTPIASKSTTACSLRVVQGDLLGAHFYAVHARVMPRLISYLKSIEDGPVRPGMLAKTPYDGALNDFRRHNSDVITLAATPQLGWQRPSRSDLSPKSVDQRWVLRAPLGAIRALKYLRMRRSR